MNDQIIKIKIPVELDGARLDAAVAKLNPASSRAYWQKLIKNGKVSCNNQVVTQLRQGVKAGDQLMMYVPRTSPDDNLPTADDNFTYPILFEDEHMLVINKPAGVVVHPAVGNHDGTVVNALLGRYPNMLDQFEECGGRPGIVHRLDKDTSGCLVIAKTPQAQFALSTSFAQREVTKKYLAITAGVPKIERGRIENTIGRHHISRQRMAVVRRNGKEAITLYDVLETGKMGSMPTALLEVNILTGRTHQIRVHLAYIGTPVVGDALYGGAKNFNLDRQMLHAWKISIPHPVTGEFLDFTSPVPSDMEMVAKKMGFRQY